ncbi:MAG: SRPBCC domain-containing protein [Bacteroidetes bacterium]|nr:SRPBCC domain-containing protein [Bacteroidota bacterium]
MKTNTLNIETAIQISKACDEVFEAIVDPGKMSHYFISESSGRLEEGKTLIWKFPEFDESFPVRASKIVKDKLISFYWDSFEGNELLVEINLESRSSNSTLVTVTEKSMENNEMGIKWLKNNTAGWTNFLACLKAYLEFGINLRKGGFDYLIKTKEI